MSLQETERERDFTEFPGQWELLVGGGGGGFELNIPRSFLFAEDTFSCSQTRLLQLIIWNREPEASCKSIRLVALWTCCFTFP